MRKILIGIICLISVPATAAQYGIYEEDEEEQITYNDDMNDDSYSDSSCNCDCDATPATSTKRHESYTGIRIYKNEHAAYAYTHPNGRHEVFKKDNFGFGTTLGNRLSDFLRVEYETLYMGANHGTRDHDFKYDLWANMFNAHLFQEFVGVVAPYLGAGIGLTGIWGEVDGDLDNSFDLSYQFMTGLLFQLNQRIDLDLGFKYVNYGQVKQEHAVSKVDATQLYIGASYKFSL